MHYHLRWVHLNALSKTILLQGHAVTLTFKVATQMLRETRHLNMVIISVKKFKNPTLNKIRL